MKKLIPSVLLAAMVLSLVFCTGCHGSKGLPEYTVPEDFDMSREYEITFWAKNDTNKTQVDIYNKAIADFEAIYPNIHVNIRLYTDYVKLYNDVITNIATNTTPNVCITYPDHIATYMTGTNTVVPLDELASDSKYGLGGSEVKFDSPSVSEVIPEFLEECKIDGTLYALPYMRSTEACYINKTYVERLGFTVPDVLTWDFIFEVADAATEKDADGNYKVNGQKVMIPFIYKSTDNMMIQYTNQNGGEYSTAAGEIKLFNDSTKSFLLSLVPHVKNGAFSTFKISSYPANFLNAGQCIFAIDSTAGSTWMGSEAPLSDIAEDKIVDFETVVRIIPQVDPENPSMISQGPSVCIFNKEDSQEVTASWIFTQYLLTNDVQIAYSQTEGYVPVTSKAQSTSEYQEYLSIEDSGKEHYYIKIQATKLLLANTENTFVTPVFNGSASLRDAAGELIEETVKSVRRKKTVDSDFIDGLYSDVSSLYRLDQGSSAFGKKEFDALPKTAVVLIVTLIVTWVLIGLYTLREYIKKKTNRKQ